MDEDLFDALLILFVLSFGIIALLVLVLKYQEGVREHFPCLRKTRKRVTPLVPAYFILQVAPKDPNSVHSPNASPSSYHRHNNGLRQTIIEVDPKHHRSNPVAALEVLGSREVLPKRSHQFPIEHTQPVQHSHFERRRSL